MTQKKHRKDTEPEAVESKGREGSAECGVRSAESRMRMVVVLVGMDEMEAVRRFLICAPEVAVPRRVTAELVPLIRGIARQYLMAR